MTSLFIELRDQLAWLYDTQENARMVVDAAGLDATVIPFSAQARANWHAILMAAVKAETVDALLAVVQADYGTNHAFQALYQRYVTFVADGGRLIPPPTASTPAAGTHAGGDLIMAAVGNNAQQVVIGKDIYIDSAPQPSMREKESAYLHALVAQCAKWAAKYTPLAGIAEVRAATVDGPRLDLPQLFMPPSFEKLVEHGFGEERRVYFVQRGSTVIVLLAGGDKRTQSRDIQIALDLARNV